MENQTDYNYIINSIENNVKKSYVAYIQDNKLVPNVANLGAKIGDVAKLERQGEYYGIVIEFLEDVKPLLTDKFIIRMLNLLKKEDYVTILGVMGLTSIDQFIYIVNKWFKQTILNEQLSIGKSNKKYILFDDWINTVISDPLPSTIKIIEIGHNQYTGASVFPSEWIDRVFKNGKELHEEMSKLETRMGKPPVTYAVIYSMYIQQYDKIINNITSINYDYIFYIDLIDNKYLSSTITNKPKKKYDYIKYNNVIIGFNKDSKQSSESSREVGILVSRLQKSIRRGRYAMKALIETIDQLNISSNYNLPEHGFLRVSASKQLVWRLFISIMEDCRPYHAIKEANLLDLILLVLITQKCQEYKFTKVVLEIIKRVAILAQYNDQVNDLYNWKKLEEADDISIDINGSDYHNAISLALSNIIMMKGDMKMLKKLFSVKKKFLPFKIPKEKLYHDKKIYKDVVLSSIDHHVKPFIILYYQACIPISMTTKEISKYIWNISSSYNVRSGKPHPKIDPILRRIQQYFYNYENNIKLVPLTKLQSYEIKKIEMEDNLKRSSFLILFGKKYIVKSTGKNQEVIIAGDKINQLKIKINNEWHQDNNLDTINKYSKQTINVSEIDPPFGFRWISDKITTEIRNGKPYIDGKKVDFFDGSSALQSITSDIKEKISSSTRTTIVNILSGNEILFDEILELKKKPLQKIMNWLPNNIKSFNLDLIKIAYTKIFNQFNNIIMIGPIDRLGHKVQNSINYNLEGKLWTVFNLFYHLYPNTLRPHGSLNFRIYKETEGYIHLINTLEDILFKYEKIKGVIPLITTKLWDHQIESVNKIVAGFERGYHGFGDAS